ncbi:MAG: sigma-54 dependent transcriptional regulator [Ignavibacterium sp.]
MTANGLIKVLLIEDEEFDVRRVMNTIKPFEERINISKVVSDGREAVKLLKESDEDFNVIIMDFQIAGGLMGEKLIQNIKEIDSSIQIIVITKMTINISDFNFANRLLKAGAFWYCTKYPIDIEESIYQPTDFIISIFNAYEKCKLEREKIQSYQKINKNIKDILEQKKIIGDSAVTKKLREDILRYANSNVNILIKGASGTGKELVAYNLHYLSSRKYENFVPINCGSLPNELIESELFGYEKGSFTGADRKKPGLFEIANHGTIFLDEITELPLQAQVKLLRVIQDGEIEKIGRTDKIKVDVRIIAATNRNIEEEVRTKRFREDLFYRLNVIPIGLLPLNKRKEDISTLINYFVDLFSMDIDKEKPAVSDEAFEILNNYLWPGNVRELKNVVQRFFFCEENFISGNQVKKFLWSLDDDKELIKENFFENILNNKILPLNEMEKVLREKYFKYVRENSSSDTEAAHKLGLAPSNYFRMAKELGLK